MVAVVPVPDVAVVAPPTALRIGAVEPVKIWARGLRPPKTVPTLFCHSCKLAVWPDKPFTISGLLPIADGVRVVVPVIVDEPVNGTLAAKSVVKLVTCD